MNTDAPLSSAAQTTFPNPVAGVSEIADGYNAFIVDLWGCVHNGIAPFPGVVDCLTSLMRAGKKVCLLTNAPRRPESNMARLEAMGVPRDCYTALMSSGEAAHRALRDRPDPFHKSLGWRCFHHGPIRDCDVHTGLGLELVAAPEAASFVLNTGIDAPEETLEQHLPMLERARAVDLPMLCVNPDLVVVIGDRRAICAGALAAAYAEMGGEVAYHGKPHAPIYRLAQRELDHPEGEPILCIGDAFHTDMAGAAHAGLDSLFVTGGIHADELDGRVHDGIAGLIDEHGIAPTYYAERMVW